ncbi:MAG: HipA domain-containing protein [Desulfobulbaceae bacterium]|nr:HipA domain-containing protein [Desulfobulbaceae bacterium]
MRISYDQATITLSPAYDIVPTPAHPGVSTDFRLAMGIGEYGREAILENALSQAERFGLQKREAQEIIRRSSEIVRYWRDIFEECGVAGDQIDLLAPSFTRC